jgi:hypothetical protein
LYRKTLRRHLEVHGPDVERLIERCHADPRENGARLEAKALATEVTRRPIANISPIGRLR